MNILPFKKPSFSLRFKPREQECAGCQTDHTKTATEFFMTLRIPVEKDGVVEPAVCAECAHHNIKLSEPQSRLWRQAVGRRFQCNPQTYLAAGGADE